MEHPKVDALMAGAKSRPHRQLSRAPTMVMMMADDIFIDEVDQSILVMTINKFYFLSIYFIGCGWEGGVQA